MTAPTALKGRADWLEWRKGGIGASDVAAILGISPWASPWSVWADKLGLLPDSDPSEAMEAGQWLELAIGPWFQHRSGLSVRAQQERRMSRDNPRHRCTIDGEVFEGSLDAGLGRVPLGGLEIKTAQPGRSWTDVPAHYQAQAQWQMHVCGWERVWFAVLMGRRLDVHELLRDDADIAFMVEKVDAFWDDHVLAEVAPPTDGHSATLRALAQVYPDHEPGGSVEIDDLAAIHAAWLEAKDAVKAAKEQVNAHQAALCAALGSAEEGTIAGQRVVSWRTQQRRDLDRDSLAARLPQVVDEFTTVTDVRVMRSHTPKKEAA